MNYLDTLFGDGWVAQISVRQDGTHPESIRSGGSHVGLPRFSNDGNYIYFLTRYTDLHDSLTEPGSPEPTSISGLENFLASFDLSNGNISLLNTNFDFEKDIPNLLSYNIYINNFSVSNDNSIFALEVHESFVVGVPGQSNLIEREPQIVVKLGPNESFKHISLTPQGNLGNGPSIEPFIVADGSRIYFNTNATDLIGFDADGVQSDTIVFDSNSRQLQYAIFIDEMQFSGHEYIRDLTPDGRYFVFNVPIGHVYRHDVGENEFERATRPSLTSQDAVGRWPVISGNGRIVAFESLGDFGFPDFRPPLLYDWDIFARDMDTGEIHWVSSTMAGTDGHNPGSTPHSREASISYDGRFIAFTSEKDQLVPNDFNGQEDVFVKDIHTGNIILISINNNNEQIFSPIDGVDISPDGRYVTYRTTASNLSDEVEQYGPFHDIFLVDLERLGFWNKIEFQSSGDGTATIGTQFADILYGSEGYDVLLGGEGSDTYVVYDPSDVVDEGYLFPDHAGRDDDFDEIISMAEWYWDAYGVAERLSVSDENSFPITILYGRLAGTEFYGNDAANFLISYGGWNTFKAGDGIDYILIYEFEGYGGANTVIVDKSAEGLSWDIIYGFRPGIDAVDLTSYDFASRDQALAFALDDGFGSSYAILLDQATLQMDVLYLVGVSVSEFDQIDFII